MNFVATSYMLQRDRASGMPSWPTQGKTCPLTLAMVLASCKQNLAFEKAITVITTQVGPPGLSPCPSPSALPWNRRGRQLKWGYRYELSELVASQRPLHCGWFWLWH